jgi:hypothetical protein
MQVDLNALNFTPAEFQECLDHLVDATQGKEPKALDDRKQHLRNGIEAFVEKNLEKRGDAIAPGLFKTGFKCALVVESHETVRPTGYSDIKTDSLKNQIIAANREMIKNSSESNKVDSFTLNHILKNVDLDYGKHNIDPKVPITGRDGHGNPLMVFARTYPEFGALKEKLCKDHEAEADMKKLYDDSWTWGRAAWVAILAQQQTREKLLERLGTLHDKDQSALADKVAKLHAKATQYGIDSLLCDNLAEDGQNYSNGSTLADEDALKDFTTLLLNQYSNNSERQVPIPKDGTPAALHALMSLFSDISVIQDKSVDSEKLTREAQISFCGEYALDCGEKGRYGEEDVVNKLCNNRPIFIREGNRFSVRMPNLPSPSDQKTAVGYPQPPDQRTPPGTEGLKEHESQNFSDTASHGGPST